MKELILDLRYSTVALLGVLCQFVWDILRIMFYMVGYPFALLYRWLVRPFHLSVWYKYHYTQYYQKCVSKHTLPRMLKLLSVDRLDRNKSLFIRNERRWAYRIIRRYRQS